MSTAVNINGTGYSVPAPGETGWVAALNSFLVALATLKATAIQFGVSTGVTNAARYATPGYAAANATEIQMPAPCTGVMRGLFVKFRTAPVGDSVVVTVRKAGVATALTATVAAAATTGSDATNTVSVTAGDLLSVSVTGGAAFASGAVDGFFVWNITPG